MQTLDDLIHFIKNIGDNDNRDTDWASELSINLPGWQTIVRDPSSWDKLEKVRAQWEYSNLCECLVMECGAPLAKRWFYSSVPEQAKIAKFWLPNFIKNWADFDKTIRDWIIKYAGIPNFLDQLDESVWKILDDDTKTLVLTKLFMLYSDDTHFSIHDYLPNLSNILFDSHQSKEQDIHNIGIYNMASTFIPAGLGHNQQPLINKIRSIISKANDDKYLDLINEMIFQREKTSKTTKIPGASQHHRVKYSPNKTERDLIALINEKTGNHGYIPVTLPDIFVSNESPPLLQAIPEENKSVSSPGENISDLSPVKNQDITTPPKEIVIDDLLGTYRPHHGQIIIYEEGIKLMKSEFDEKSLFTVVLIHEIGHWITHMLPKPGIPEWHTAWQTRLYTLTEKEVKEGWAQLIAFWISNEENGRFKATFEKLNKNLPSLYHVFEEFKSISINTMFDTLDELRLLSHPATLRDWRSMV